MLKLEDLKKDAEVRGLEGDAVVRIVMAEPVGADAANVFYVDADGSECPRLLQHFDRRVRPAFFNRSGRKSDGAH